MSSQYKLEKNIVLNVLNILQNMFIWNNGIRGILDSEFHTGICSTYIVMTRPFLSINDYGEECLVTDIKHFVDMVM